MSKNQHVDEEAFDKVVADLEKWLKKRCCPECAVSVLGAVAGAMIWDYTASNKIAKEEAKDFCERLTCHIYVLCANDPDQSEGAPLQ